MRYLSLLGSALLVAAGLSFGGAASTADPTLGTEATTQAEPAPLAAEVAAQPAAEHEEELIEADAATADDLVGMVQSVDRRNRSLVLQDGDGNNHLVSLQEDLRIYRRGEEVSYRDVEPNDVIRLDYDSES